MEIILELIHSPVITVENAKTVIEKNNGFFLGILLMACSLFQAWKVHIPYI